MGTRMALIAAVALMLWPAGTTPTAKAAPRFQRVATTTEGFWVAGARWVVYETRQGALRITDTWRGTTRTLRGPRCQYNLRRAAEDLISAGCGAGFPQVISARTGRPISTPGLDAVRAEVSACASCRINVQDVGTHWIAYAVESLYGGSRPTQYVDWRTGARRDRSTSDREIEDVSFPGLMRPLCPSLRHELQLRPFPPTIEFRAGWWWSHEEGVVLRCGHAPVDLPWPPAAAALPYSVAGVGLSRDTRHVDVYAARLDSGRRVRWRLPGIQAGNLLVRVTRDYVYAQRVRPNDRGVLYRARIPR